MALDGSKSHSIPSIELLFDSSAQKEPSSLASSRTVPGYITIEQRSYKLLSKLPGDISSHIGVEFYRATAVDTTGAFLIKVIGQRHVNLLGSGLQYFVDEKEMMERLGLSENTRNSTASEEDPEEIKSIYDLGTVREEVKALQTMVDTNCRFAVGYLGSIQDKNNVYIVWSLPLAINQTVPGNPTCRHDTQLHVHLSDWFKLCE